MGKEKTENLIQRMIPRGHNADQFLGERRKKKYAARSRKSGLDGKEGVLVGRGHRK